MKRIVTFILCVFVSITAFADGQEWLNHGNDLYRQKRYKEAIAAYEHARLYGDVPGNMLDDHIKECNLLIDKANQAAAAKKKKEKEDAEAAKQARIDNNLVYFSSSARMLDGYYTSFQSKIKGNLKEFSFIKDPDVARWGVYIVACVDKTSDRASGGPFFSWVTAVVQIVDFTSAEEIVLEQEYLSPKGSDMNFNRSIQKAYNQLAPIIASDISEIINEKTLVETNE